MKKSNTYNPGYEALQQNLPETMGLHRQAIVHALTANTLRHYKELPTVADVSLGIQDSYPVQRSAQMRPDTQAQVLDLGQQREIANRDDIRLAVNLAYENPIYDQKAS